MEELKDRLISARKAKKLSQKQLAKAIGVNQSIIGSLETGYRKTSAYIPAIADVLEVEALWLTEGKLPREKISKILTFDESLLVMLGLSSDKVGADLIKDLQEFAKESPSDRSKALNRLKEDKVSSSQGEGTGAKGKQPC